MTGQILHPLDPLSAEELASGMSHARQAWNVGFNHFVITCQLEEPD